MLFLRLPLWHDGVCAVYDDALAGEVAGVWACEEGDNWCDVVFRIAEALHWVEVDLFFVFFREFLRPFFGCRGFCTWKYDIHTDAVLAPFFCGNFGKTAKGFFVGAVSELSGNPEHTGCGCKVNDASFVLFFHVWECSLHIVEGADDTTLPCFEHAFVGGVFYRCGWHDGLAVVDNDVDGAKGVHGFLNNSCDASRVTGVTGERQTIATQFFDFLDGLLDWVLATAGGNDFYATFCQAKRDALANALAGTGYNSNFFV